MFILRKYSLVLVVAAVTLGASPAVSRGDIVITHDGSTTNDGGTGFGTVLNLLSLQSNDPVETGSITRVNGADVMDGDANVPPSQTVTVQQLLDIGVSAADNGVSMVFNINEPGSAEAVTLDAFTLYVTDNQGGAIAGVDNEASYLGVPKFFPEIAGQGTGSAGYVFDVLFTPAEWALFLSSPTNRIGAYASVSGNAGGRENFYLARVAAVPEPSSIMLLSLLGAAGVVGRTIRRKKAENGASEMN